MVTTLILLLGLGSAATTAGVLLARSIESDLNKVADMAQGIGKMGRECKRIARDMNKLHLPHGEDFAMPVEARVMDSRKILSHELFFGRN
ncbi:MAG: hypothetical protein JXR97_11260 [Planctomycetes bacterium]|nr:hypothetical protein [Planctomycetota bacterium]